MSNQQHPQTFKVYVGIDFGTDGSALSYAIPDIDGKRDANVYIHKWKDHDCTKKPKTSILFDSDGNVQGEGDKATQTYIQAAKYNQGWKLFERFKMSLYENNPSWFSEINASSKQIRAENRVDIKEKIAASNNEAEHAESETVFVACLQWLKSEAMEFIHKLCKKPMYKKQKFSVSEDEIQWILTVPAIWSESAKNKMKQWALKAGLVRVDQRTDSKEEDEEDEEKEQKEGSAVSSSQLKIVYEPDCGALSIQHAVLRNMEQKEEEEEKGPGCMKAQKKKSKKNKDLLPHRPQINMNARFKKGDKYILLDVGGGTCDVACHEVMDQFAIAEVLHPSGGPWGACNIDIAFEQLLHEVFGKERMDDFKAKNPDMYRQQMENFIIDSKPTFFDKNQKYPTVTLVRNLVDFLNETLEEERNAEEYEETQSNPTDDGEDDKHDDNNTDEGTDDEDEEGESFLDKYLKKRCMTLYKTEDMILVQDNGNQFAESYSLAIHVHLWKTKLFDIIIDKIIQHCEKIVRSKHMHSCKYIILIGGFANSAYFQQRIRDTFPQQHILIPELPQLCVVDGAARYGLQPRFMRVRRLAHSYGVKADRFRLFLDESVFPKGWIEEHLDKRDGDDEYVRDVFWKLAEKNKPISIEEQPTVYMAMKTFPTQTEAVLELYESEKVNPATCEQHEARLRGKSVVLFDEQHDRVWVEFHFSDTMMTVYAYTDEKEKKTKCKIEVEYE